MSTFLFLGLSCQKYKKNPKIRLNVNNRFIDEFDLDHNDHYRRVNVHELLHPHTNKDRKWILPYTKIYKLNLYDQANIIVDIKNSDSNYTNGFMTKSTMVKLDFMYLVEETVLRGIDHIRKNYILGRKNSAHNIKLIKIYFNGKKPGMFNNFFKDAEIPYGENIVKESPTQCWIGGNYETSFLLKKKLGFWQHSNCKTLGFLDLGQVEFIKLLYDKYLCNENR